MSRFLAIIGDLAGGAPLGLALVSGSALMQRHAAGCPHGLWLVRHFEQNNHRVDPAALAVMDDFGNLTEVTQ